MKNNRSCMIILIVVIGTIILSALISLVIIHNKNHKDKSKENRDKKGNIAKEIIDDLDKDDKHRSKKIKRFFYKILEFFEKIKYQTLLIDILFLFIVITSICIDLKFKNSSSNKPFLNLKFNDATLILTDLLPLAMTILSIVISLTKDEINGLTLRDLNKISKPNFFNLLHIYVISIVSFLFNISFIYFELKLSTMVLQIVCLIYCTIFGFQQLGLIYHKTNAIKGIIRFKYRKAKRPTNNDETSDINNYDTAVILMTNIIFKDGIYILYKTIKKKNKFLFIKLNKNKTYNFNIFKYILSIEIDYFERLLHKINESNLAKGDLDEFEGIDIFTAIQKGYESLISIANIIKAERFDKKDNELYQNYARLSFLLHKLSLKLDINEDQSYIHLLNVFEYENKSNDVNENILLYLCLVVVNSLNDDDLWFIKIYREFITSHCNVLFSKYHPFYVFTNFLMIFLVSNSKNEDDSNIKKLMNETYKGLDDGDTNWNKTFVAFLERLDDEKRLSLLDKLLYIYDNMNYVVGFFYQYKHPKNKIFAKDIIFQYWFQLILFSYNEISEKLEDVLGELDGANRTAFAKFANKGFDENGKVNFSLDFINELSSKYEVLYDNQEALIKPYSTIFYEYASKISSEEKIKELKENNRDEAIDQVYKNLIDLFKKQIEDIPFQDNNYTNGKKHIIPIDRLFRVIDNNLENTIHFYYYHFLWDRLFYSKLESTIIYKEFEKKLEVIGNRDYFYTDKTLEEFKKNEIKYVSNIEKIKGDSSNFTPIDIMNKSPRDFVCKEGAIKINAIINEENSFLKPMSQSQIKIYIANNYTKLDNGFYRYIENDGTSYLLSKEKLIELLSKECFALHIEIDFAYEIKDEGCFIVERWEKENDEA